MEFDFPFIDYSDEELDEHIDYCLKEIYKLVFERDFEFIETWGKTLIDLETERVLRSVKH